MEEMQGYEALRRLGLEPSIKSRGEVMQFKEKFMSTSVRKNAGVMDIARHVESQASQYNHSCSFELCQRWEFAVTGCRSGAR